MFPGLLLHFKKLQSKAHSDQAMFQAPSGHTFGMPEMESPDNEVS